MAGITGFRPARPAVGRVSLPGPLPLFGFVPPGIFGSVGDSTWDPPRWVPDSQSLLLFPDHMPDDDLYSRPSSAAGEGPNMSILALQMHPAQVFRLFFVLSRRRVFGPENFEMNSSLS